jgi:CCR4-NOT transcription complex subunit 6
MYPYCDAWSLSWPYRRKMLLQELEETQGDILCLQEVQADHFEQQLRPALVELGYEAIFRQKSRESMGQQGKVDGCAVLWRRSKFALVESLTIDFNDCALRSARAIGLDDTECRRYVNRLSKDNIAQVVVLEAARTNPQGVSMRNHRNLLCVANTHLYSNYQRPDVKLWQSLALVSELEHLVAHRDIPVILCGDFNSEPDSAVYELLTQGRLDARPRPELDERGDMRILPAYESIRHALDLSSAMAVVSGEEPVFTNYTGKFRGTLDYIFYSPSRLRVLAASSIPPQEELQRSSGEGLPSACYPSDHLHLCCDMLMMPSSMHGGGAHHSAGKQERGK